MHARFARLRISLPAAIFLFACTAGLHAQTDIPDQPHHLAAAAVASFAYATVVPLDRAALARDLCESLSRELPDLEVIANDGARFLIDDRDDHRRIRISAELVDHARRLADVLARIFARRPEVKAERAIRRALTAAFAKHDPYARVITRGRYGVEVERLDGRAAGIGIGWIPGNTGVEVASVRPDSPAERAGLVAGDWILGVDATLLAGLEVPAIRALLRGPDGSRVNLLVLSPSGERRWVTTARAILDEPSTQMTAEPGRIHVIRIDRFSSGLSSQIRRYLTGRVLRVARRGGIVLDLRGNAGGRLDGAHAIANLFLRDGPLFRGFDKNRRQTVRSDAEATQTWWRTPLVVLVDRRTLSAAEILAGVLRERDRALIIGERTGGKGLGQVGVDLPMGHTLLVSTMRLETAGGRMIQGYGVQPHAHVHVGRRNADHRYLWVHAPSAEQGPVRKLRPAANAEDAALETALQTLRTWNNDRSRTLLEAFDAAIDEAPASSR